VVAATIRSGTVADARAIATVHVASWRWAYRGALPDDLLDDLSVEEREPGWRSVLDDGATITLVAVRGDHVVGFANGGASRDDDAEASIGEILSIYVTQQEAGAGTGRALLVAIQDGLRGRGFEGATLWVLETNARARTFYERQGWAWDGSRADHQVQCANRPIVRHATEL